MKIIGVIPARYKSSRFPGKPLADICGKPMVWWVYQQAIKVQELDEVYVATDDDRIISACNDLNIKVLKTSDAHPTGTDRVVEVSEKIDGDLYVVVMGDEPLIKSEDIRSLIIAMADNETCSAGMICTKFKNGVDLINSSTIKLAVNENFELIYMSRMPIPFPKAELNYDHYKNVGVYAFRKDALRFFKQTPRGRLERIEDMEMMRLLENHKIVKVVNIDTDAMSVDTHKDLDRIRTAIQQTFIQSAQTPNCTTGGAALDSRLCIMHYSFFSMRGGIAA